MESHGFDYLHTYDFRAYDFSSSTAAVIREEQDEVVSDKDQQSTKAQARDTNKQ